MGGNCELEKLKSAHHIAVRTIPIVLWEGVGHRERTKWAAAGLATD